MSVDQDAVNVASVPQRSPFRYPGGKTWLVPRVRQWLRSIQPKAAELFEPFAGGAIVGLTAAFEGLADHVTLCELDPDIAAVWETIINGGAEWLANRVVSYEMADASVRQALSDAPTCRRERAFLTLLRNRVSRGGILAPGAGWMKKGENGRGIRSRWYPLTLKRRILAIAGVRSHLSFEHGDGLETLRRNANRSDAAFFIDPPYTLAGRRLYRHHDIDHAALFDLAAGLSGSFVMTYDNVEEVRALARSRGFQYALVPMKSAHHTLKKELLICRDLDWLNA